MVRLFRDWVFLPYVSGTKTKQLSISHGGQQFMVSPIENGSGLHSHCMTYDWQQLPSTRKNCHTILRFKQGFDRRLSTIGKSLRFTIPYSKANNKSKSVWWSIHPAPKSLPCIWFSESRILTLGHPHKHCRISLVDELSSDKSIDSASQTNIYRSFTTLRFCVTPIRSSVSKVVISSQGFSFSKSVLASWQVLGPVGYGPSHHL